MGGHARARFRTGDDCAATRRTEAVADPRLLARAVTAITAAACAKIGLHRIFTDGEINVAVKSERLCLAGDRYIDFWKAAQMDDLLPEFLTETSVGVRRLFRKEAEK